MKKLLLFGALSLSTLTFGQSYFSIGTDITGDDYSFGLDVTELSYGISPGNDSLYVKITHNNLRNSDFGFALAIDTNLNTADGRAVNQTNIKNNSPNTSMNYDILLLAYQNGFFPGVFTEAREGSTGNLITLDFELDTVDPHYSVFRIALADIGGNYDLNLIGFCGGFDISSSGPSDAIPNSTYGELRDATIGINEQSSVKPFTVYPNPAASQIQIDGLKDDQQILIRDITGKIIAAPSLQNGLLKLPLTAEGLYLLQDPEGGDVVKIQFKP